MSVEHLTIFGAGLIGGSLALAARERQLAEHIVATDVVLPEGSHPFDEVLSATDEPALERTLAHSDLVVLCVPVRTIIGLLPWCLERTSGIVTDCGSTKGAIAGGVADHSQRARFVAGHPMAGHPEGGLRNARADLFEGRKWLLCPEGSNAEARALVSSFVTGLGAHAIELSAAEHDRSVAVTSHLPQVVASALSVFAEEEDAKQAAGPGFASATRVAGGAEAMWRDIFETNGPAIGSSLVDLGEKLQSLGRDLQKGDLRAPLQTLDMARRSRDQS